MIRPRPLTHKTDLWDLILGGVVITCIMILVLTQQSKDLKPTPKPYVQPPTPELPNKFKNQKPLFYIAKGENNVRQNILQYG